MNHRTTGVLSVLTVAAVLVLPSSMMAERATGGTVALVNVRVVSMNPDQKKTSTKRQTVIVEDGRITKIGKAKQVEIPTDAQVVEGKNKLWVLPGLTDAHIHHADIPRLPEKFAPEEIYILYFANGVTTLLDMAGFKGEFKWRKGHRPRQGHRPGPLLHLADHR